MQWKKLTTPTISISGHTFVPVRPGAHTVVIDLGANRGDFIRLVQERFSCRCIAIEASPKLVDELNLIKEIEVYHAAAAGHCGDVTFHLSDDIYSSNIFRPAAGKVSNTVCVRAFDLRAILDLTEVSRVELMKVDIEGAEIELIDSADPAVLSKINQLSIEYHEFCGLVNQQDVNRIRKKLVEAGFDEFRFGPADYNNLYINRKNYDISLLHRAYLRLAAAPFSRLVYYPVRAGWHRIRRPAMSMISIVPR